MCSHRSDDAQTQIVKKKYYFNKNIVILYISNYKNWVKYNEQSQKNSEGASTPQ